MPRGCAGGTSPGTRRLHSRPRDHSPTTLSRLPAEGRGGGCTAPAAPRRAHLAPTAGFRGRSAEDFDSQPPGAAQKQTRPPPRPRRVPRRPPGTPAYLARSAGYLCRNTEFLCSRPRAPGQKPGAALSRQPSSLARPAPPDPGVPALALSPASEWDPQTEPGSCPPLHPTPRSARSLPSTISLEPAPKYSCPVFARPWDPRLKPAFPD